MRRALWGGVLLVLILGLPALHAVAAADLTGTGTVEGDLTAGSLLTVKLHIRHVDGWQHVQKVDVDLDLRGNALERLEFDPSLTALSIAGGGAPVSLGDSVHITGAYFDVNAAQVALTARGEVMNMTVPIRLRIAPPPGARLTFNATAVPLAELGFKALTPPVGSNSGFSWGTLGLAIAVALFAGGFVGNIFSSRRRPTRGPSIYAAVQRGLDREKAAK